MARHQSEVEAVLMSKPSPGFILKKLPMWGQQVGEAQIDFEWPTHEILERMDPSVTLKSLSFKGNN